MDYKELLIRRGATEDEADTIISAAREFFLAWGSGFGEAINALSDVFFSIAEMVRETMHKLIEILEDVLDLPEKKCYKPNTPYRQWQQFMLVHNSRHYRRGAYV